MDEPQGGGDHQSFAIQVITTSSSSSSGGSELPPQTRVYSPAPPKLKYFSAMKIFNRLRKIVMRFIFSSRPSRGGSPPARSVPRQRSGDHRRDPPKTSCSSYYSSSSHYNEAIADCIEFFNKSSQEGPVFCGRGSDDMMV